MCAPLLGVCVELLAPAALVGVRVLLLGASPSELLASGAALWSGFIHYAKPRERRTRLITRANATVGAPAVEHGLIWMGEPGRDPVHSNSVQKDPNNR